MENNNPNIRINRIKHQIKKCEKRLDLIRFAKVSMTTNSTLWYYLCDADNRNPSDIDKAKKELELKAKKLELELEALKEKLREEMDEQCPVGKKMVFCDTFNK